jgi:hypothetical protein
MLSNYLYYQENEITNCQRADMVSAGQTPYTALMGAGLLSPANLTLPEGRERRSVLSAGAPVTCAYLSPKGPRCALALVA